MTDEQFKKLTKEEKLALEREDCPSTVAPTWILLVPTDERFDEEEEYKYGATFLYFQEEDRWMRVPGYDCFSITLNGDSAYIRGDFEYDGVRFFHLLGNRKMTWRYANNIEIHEK